MATDESHDVLFVAAPFRDDLRVPQAFELRLSANGMAILNDLIASRESHAFNIVFEDGTVFFLEAKAIRSRYGFIQLEPVAP
jgi:hypothetical protein